MKVEVTVDRRLHSLALQYAVVWKEPVADVIEQALVEFLKSQDSKAVTENKARVSPPPQDRASVLISPGLCKSAHDFTTSIGITMDQLLDMSVQRFCRIG